MGVLTFVFKKGTQFFRSFSYAAPIAQCKFKIQTQSIWNDLFCRFGLPPEMGWCCYSKFVSLFSHKQTMMTPKNPQWTEWLFQVQASLFSKLNNTQMRSLLSIILFCCLIKETSRLRLNCWTIREAVTFSRIFLQTGIFGGFYLYLFTGSFAR